MVQCEYGWVDIYSKVNRERVGSTYLRGEGTVWFLFVPGMVRPKSDVFASSTGTVGDNNFCIEPHGVTQNTKFLDDNTVTERVIEGTSEAKFE